MGYKHLQFITNLKRNSLPMMVLATSVLLFACLGARELWTQESRWALIVSGMFYRHDFLHPFLGLDPYYDKPLLSYWLISLVSLLFGDINNWALRLPSALSGLLALWSIYKIAAVENKQVGYLSCLMLATTYYFVFWARTSSADMMNLAGSLFAISWFITRKDEVRFFNYFIFFLIVSITCLCKGLIGAVIPAIAVFIRVILDKSQLRHMNRSLFYALFFATVIYLIPFLASAYYGKTTEDSGLYNVYRENILRYIQPFDHQNPIHIYFLYLPIYLLPWTLFFIPALIRLAKQNVTQDIEQSWLLLTLYCSFIFLTLSGSRRGYYILPLVPFGILITAHWLAIASVNIKKFASIIFYVFYFLLCVWFMILQPLYYRNDSLINFSQQMAPYKNQKMILLDAEYNVPFYLHIPIPEQNLLTEDVIRNKVILNHIIKNNQGAIFITRQKHQDKVKARLYGYKVISAAPSYGERLLGKHNSNLPIAFIPNSS